MWVVRPKDFLGFKMVKGEGECQIDLLLESKEDKNGKVKYIYES